MKNIYFDSVVVIIWIFSIVFCFCKKKIDVKMFNVEISSISKKVNFIFWFPILYTLIHFIYIYFFGAPFDTGFIGGHLYGFEAIQWHLFLILFSCLIPIIVSLVLYIIYIVGLYKFKKKIKKNL